MFNFPRFIIYITNFLLVLNSIHCSEHCSEEIRAKCQTFTDCDDCLKFHPCCEYCFEPLPNAKNEPKCDIRKNLRTICEESKMEINYQSKSSPIENEDYSTVGTSIQFKPQKINIDLKEGIPINVTINFKSAKNYPLDLYYLLDMSYDMQSHIDFLIDLAQELPQTLQELTKNYKIAFGTFMDKIAFPYAHTDKSIFHEMCLQYTGSNEALNCDETGYLYRHHLDFHSNVSKFIDALKNVKLSGNNDLPEAALEAVHQVIFCKNIINWRSNSRKIILIPTSGTLKLAGDGILAGAVRYPVKLKDKCHLDNKGNYINPLSYDYPSLEEIDYILDKEKTKLIFGIQESNELYSYYSHLQKTALENVILISNMTQKENNIKQIITEGFYNFAHRVNIFINASHLDDLDIEYYAKCGKRKRVKKGSACELSAKNPYDELTFNISFTLKKKTAKSDGITLFVEEESLREKVELNFKFLSAKCKCDTNVVTLENGHGERRCNKTMCHEGWSGEDCSINCELASYNECRSEEEARICSGNGDCKCGQCECFHSYAGKYCENECPMDRKTRRICFGNGVCTNNGCICNQNFNGTDCSCSMLKDNCLANEKICSGRGECECNRCKCDVNFAGRVCEKISKRFCTLYRDIAEDKNIWQNPGQYQNIYIRGMQNDFNKPQNIYECTDNTCEIVDNDDCTVKFCGVFENDKINLFIVQQSCPFSAGFQLSIGLFVVFASIVLIGLLLLCIRIWKLRRDEKREFALFERERNDPFSLSASENPYYKSPITMVRNPQYKKKN